METFLFHNVFFQSSREQENSLTAHINYGYISSTNSLLRSSFEDCRCVFTLTLPHDCHDDAGQVQLSHGIFGSNAYAKVIDYSLKTRKRKRNPNTEIYKRPRSLYDQVDSSLNNSLTAKLTYVVSFKDTQQLEILF